MRACTSGLNSTKPSPGGVAVPFWLPDTMTSTPHAAGRSSATPYEVMPSAMMIRSGFCAFAAWAIASRSCRAPVLVSLCVMSSVCASRAASATSCGSRTSPQGLDTRLVSYPKRRAISPQRSLNFPAWAFTTFAPPGVVLTSAPSNAPVPLLVVMTASYGSPNSRVSFSRASISLAIPACAR